VRVGPRLDTWRSLALLAVIALTAAAVVGLIGAVIYSATMHATAVRQPPYADSP